MKYYDSEDIDVLTMPMSYILDNFYDLFESVTKLSDKNILINPSKNEAIRANYKKLCYLFRDLFINAISTYHIELFDVGLIINSLFDYRRDTTSIYRKLKSYKYPIDYITSKRNM